MMHDHGQSDSPVVPTKSPNNAAEPAAEATEGSGLAKGNSPDSHGDRTQRRVVPPDGIERVRQAAKRDRKQRFTALLHHVYDVDRLRTGTSRSSETRSRASMAKRGGTTARRLKRIFRTSRPA